MATFDVNTDAVINLTAKLERLSRSAFPNAVRFTLNDAAFDLKRKELPKSFKNNFKPKAGTLPFLRKVIVVDKATGWNVNGMKSTTGFIGSKADRSKAFVEGLEKQEYGGKANKGLRYLKSARGGSNRRRVLQQNYFKKGNVIKRPSKGTERSKFVAMAYTSLKTGKPFVMRNAKGNFLVKTKSVSSIRATRKLKFKNELHGQDRNGNPNYINATGFNSKAAFITSKRVDSFYIKNAQFQFNKYLK